ncbi:hypothetical protein [Rhizobium oryzicola]|uniref:DUF3618 domain-containing protein n=1 Tax=Rhizobium oryzicola TaxID=1232668 RepID=A0ABT8SWT8_9HYPH|nr:hypothetical protein [Rhizobium oryzicola]MDO1582770.1 hypothetical protein [Rhizobium oryzicola]
MSGNRDNATPNAAQIRGDIQRGLTGDKRPGFDPALAPLETDAEAGGVPMSSEQVETAIETQRKDGLQQQSRNFDVAMGSSFKGTRNRKPSLPALVPVLAVFVVGLALLLGVWLR